MKASVQIGFIGGSRKRKMGVDKRRRKQQAVLPFHKGSVVEVCIDNHHDFNGDACSWFEATILNMPNPTSTRRAARNAFLVKFHTLVTAGSMPLKQFVQPSRVRPFPPLIEPDDSSFELNCVVDAFFRDGWRIGIITREAEENNSKFRVLFQNPAEEVEFDRKNLRVPQDWVDGKWVLSEIKEIKHQRVGVKTLKKRIARPRKFESPNIPAGEEQQEAGDTDDAMGVQDSAGLSHVSTVTQWNESWESQEETVRHSIGFDAVSDNVLVDSQNLPFVKSSPVWKALESMKVFQKMPQNPHFHSLHNCKEDFREGLAIGHMVTFAALVERTFKLQFDEPRSAIETSLETLTNLEMDGFDVNVVRDQLHKFLLLEEKERQIVEHVRERSKVEEELDEMQKKIMDLQEKCVMLKSMKASRESQMALLKLIVDNVNEKMQSLQHDFEELAAAPL